MVKLISKGGSTRCTKARPSILGKSDNYNTFDSRWRDGTVNQEDKKLRRTGNEGNGAEASDQSLSLAPLGKTKGDMYHDEDGKAKGSKENYAIAKSAMKSVDTMAVLPIIPIRLLGASDIKTTLKCEDEHLPLIKDMLSRLLTHTNLEAPPLLLAFFLPLRAPAQLLASQLSFITLFLPRIDWDSKPPPNLFSAGGTILARFKWDDMTG